MKLKQVIESSPDGFPVVDLPVEAAKDLQGLLNDCGYQLQADGIPGAKTQAAFESWKVAADQSNGKIVGAGSYKLLVDEAQERKNGLAPHDEPITTLTEKRDRGRLFHVPGIIKEVGEFDPIYNYSNFRWYEATKSLQRIPETALITERIIMKAKFMDEVRSHFKHRPIHINSWFRDRRTNAAVGGASGSQHLNGWACDWWIDGLAITDIFEEMKRWKPDLSMAPGDGFIHSDLRPKPAARWRYAGAHPNIPLW